MLGEEVRHKRVSVVSVYLLLLRNARRWRLVGIRNKSVVAEGWREGW